MKNKTGSLNFLFLIIFLIWFSSSLLVWFFFKDWSKSGTFGDTFGAINSLFSGLALGGIIYTIYLQKTELSLQRDELKLTRKEIKRTANAQEASSLLLTEQIRLNNMPLIEFKSKQDLGVENYLIRNISNNVAFDVRLLLVVSTQNEKCPKKNFINKQIDLNDQRQYSNLNELTPNGEWGFFMANSFHTLKSDEKILVPLLLFNLINTSVFLNIQYKDNLNNNYSQNLYIKEIENSRKFKTVAYFPRVPTVTDDMINFDFIESQDSLRKLDATSQKIYELIEVSLNIKHFKDYKLNYNNVDIRIE